MYSEDKEKDLKTSKKQTNKKIARGVEEQKNKINLITYISEELPTSEHTE